MLGRLVKHRRAIMRKLDATLIFAIAVAIAASSPASAKVAKSSSSSKLYEHTATGQHYKQVKITAKKTGGSKPSDISVTKTMDKSSAK